MTLEGDPVAGRIGSLRGAPIQAESRLFEIFNLGIESQLIGEGEPIQQFWLGEFKKQSTVWAFAIGSISTGEESEIDDCLRPKEQLGGSRGNHQARRDAA